ncbi:hypothetical protein PG993_005177 [Apiospora rasikravindrae]|uniref:LCCL domain-containing protein n=1 Tax=Apiospora rasikravindrae TaxID=990691 RepID=A0ABR1THI7_9PEZI
MSSGSRVQTLAGSQSPSSLVGLKESRKLSNGWTPKPAAVNSQQLPTARWFRQTFPRSEQRSAVYLVVSLLCALTVLMLSSTGSGVPPMEVADGVYQPVVQLSCTDSFWLPDNGCGIEGEKCQPFSENVLAFRCPANCVTAAKKKKTKSAASSSKERPHYVGPEVITDGRPLVVGAGPYFRADSHICAAAVYSELLKDSEGGCGIATTSGMTSMFPAGSPEHGVTPVPLRTYFPMAYRFKYDSGIACGRPQDESGISSGSARAVAPLLTAAAYTALVFLFANSAATKLLSAEAAGFVATRIALTGPDVSALPAHFRTAAKSSQFLPATGAFLVALACTAILLRLTTRRSLQRLTTTYDETTLWLGAFWLGLLSLCIFPWMPSTLLSTPMYYWIMVLILLPESRLRENARLGGQALLFGLFVYSIASTGLALPFSARQASSHTVHHVRSAPAFVPSPRYPQILEPEISVGFGGSNATFIWRTPVPEGVDGISILVNDIERERKWFTTGAGKNGRYGSFDLRRTPQAVPDYIRFSWLQDDHVLGWSEAGIWEIDESSDRIPTVGGGSRSAGDVGCRQLDVDDVPLQPTLSPAVISVQMSPSSPTEYSQGLKKPVGAMQFLIRALLRSDMIAAKAGAAAEGLGGDVGEASARLVVETLPLIAELLQKPRDGGILVRGHRPDIAEPSRGETYSALRSHAERIPDGGHVGAGRRKYWFEASGVVAIIRLAIRTRIRTKE